MKALSVRQPWAWLLANGYKPVENRTWPTKFRGPILIHASAGLSRAEYDLACSMVMDRCISVDIPDYEDIERGGIVGVMDITGMCESHPSPFFVGPVGWQVANARPLAFFPMKGRLSLFETGLTMDGDQLMPEVNHV